MMIMIIKRRRAYPAFIDTIQVGDYDGDDDGNDHNDDDDDDDHNDDDKDEKEIVPHLQRHTF